MKQNAINFYILVSAILAIATTFLETQPALLFIDFLAPNPGDKYSLAFVLLMTFLILIIPLLLFLVFSRLLVTSQAERIPIEKTGVIITRQKSLTSALVGTPIYFDDNKIGEVANGKTVFFAVSEGTYTIQAGKGKQASEKIEVSILEMKQLKFNLKINKDGLFPKYDLNLIEE